MRPEDEQQYRRFLRIYNETDTIFSAYGRTHGLSPAAFSILYSLSLESRPQSQAELCRSWSLARQTVNSAVRTLKANGLVRLEPLPGQGRRKALELTGIWLNTAATSLIVSLLAYLILMRKKKQGAFDLRPADPAT
jgi:DNA-binding MarR family transcriptional regulator